MLKTNSDIYNMTKATCGYFNCLVGLYPSVGKLGNIMIGPLSTVVPFPPTTNTLHPPQAADFKHTLKSVTVMIIWPSGLHLSMSVMGYN